MAAGYAVIVLVTLKEFYEISLCGIFTFRGKVFFHSTKDIYYCMIVCQHLIVYFNNIFQKIGLLVLKGILLEVKSCEMLNFVDWRRFQDTY